MTFARVAVFGEGTAPTQSDTIELPDVELVRSSHIVDVYRSGVIGWSQFRNIASPYNQIDTHINALIAIRNRMQKDAATKARTEEEARKAAEVFRTARVDEILKEAGFSFLYGVDPAARRLAEKFFEMEQEAKK